MNARFECPQCHYRYNLSKFEITKVLSEGRWLVPVAMLLLFSAIWAIGVFISFSAVNIGLMTPTGGRDIVWSHQNMLSSLIIVSFMGLVYCAIFEGLAIFFVFNLQSLLNTQNIRGLFSVLLLYGLARVIAGIYDAATILTSRVRNSPRDRVLDIRCRRERHVR
jgi:hypothetical protein